MPRAWAIPSEEIIKKVAGFVAAGHYAETSCAFAGVSKKTYLLWLREGRRYQQMKEDRPDETLPDPRREAYLAFLEAIEKALATAEVRDLTVIDKVAQGGLPMGQTTVTTRRVPMVSNVTGEPLRDPATNEILYKVETTEVESKSTTLPQWTAAAWRLERRNAERWSRTTKHQVAQKQQDLIPVNSLRSILEGDDDEDVDLGDA